MDETLLTASRRVVRFYRIDEQHGGLPSLDTIKAIETLDKQIRQSETREAAKSGAFDLIAHLHRQQDFSLRTFGPGPRTKGVCDHIRKELDEIEADPADADEWIDVVLLALDGLWRSGVSPREAARRLDAKQTKNEGRRWPDWRTMSPDKAIEHDRSADRGGDA